ncbi:MAG: sensor histidine kinase [Flavobacterium sp.]
MVKPKLLERLELLLKIGINSLIILAIIPFIGFYFLNKQLETVKEASEKRVKSILIANELRQTSDNLTRMARNYVITKDPSQKTNYENILKIRNGELARPLAANAIYLDQLSPAGIKTFSKDENPYSLIEIAINEGINDEEINILKEAKKLSDLLAIKEEKAFEFTETNRQAQANELVFGNSYDSEKNAIIYTLNDFHNSLNNRTQKELELQEKNLDKIIQTMSFVFVLSILFFAIIVYTLKKINKIISEAYFRIEKYSEKVTKINDSKNKFFSIIAHDIKSPFIGFLGLTQMLSEDIKQLSYEEIQELSKSMHKSANNLYELLENLLEWANIENGISEYKPKKLSVSEIVNKNIELHRDLLIQKNIELTNSITDSTEVLADKRMLNIILRNLISNAIKFTPHGGKIEIGIEKNKLNPAFQTIYVKDNGLGMSESTIEKVFKINAKTSELGTDGEKGTGLGLILCKEFINKNNGEIWIESQEGQGSTFYFTLPIV